MYKRLKNILKRVIPNSLIKRNENLLRNSVSIFYSGSKYQCNLCGFKLSKFVNVNSNSLLCPKCGSISRSRRLWSMLKDNISNKQILHFSPPKSLQKKFMQSDVKAYITSDYMGEFEAMKRLNIEAIDEPNNYFDLVICYHILEHITNDIKAISELFRILKPNGSCYVQTPFKDGEIYEDASISSKEERLIHFGQDDHLRIYSVSGLVNRLHSVGFKTDVLQFNTNDDNPHGFINETVIVATKL